MCQAEDGIRDICLSRGLGYVYKRQAVDDDALAVTADMNGNIWKVLVNPGDTVEAGQTLIIVEAMKMELAISAPQAGVVKRIGCQPGRPVSPGDALLWLE